MPNDRSDDRNHHVLSCTKWHNPPIGKLKCNVDAAFRERELWWGCGISLRNHEGAVVSIRTSWRRGLPTVKEGEALALLEAMEWLENSGYRDVIIEVDSSIVAAAVMSHEDDTTEFGGIIAKCREICNSQSSFQVNGVRRNRNRVAHELAQRSFSLASPFIGHAPPLWLESAMSETCSDLTH
ncbi:hypothetical protein LINPERHAP1_LOCUS32159 [Linum perenne]